MLVRASMMAVAAALAVTHAAAQGTSVKVMSFNLRTSVAGDKGLASWEHRRGPAAEAVLRIAPDFVGTQEGTEEQYQYMRSQCMGYEAIGECAGPCTGANERNFILYNTANWEMIDHGDFALSDTPGEFGSNTWGLEYNRMATWGRFRHTSSGEQVCYFNTHFDQSKGQSKSAALIASQMASLCDPDELAVLTGDLNSMPDREPIQYLLGNKKVDGGMSPRPLVSSLEVMGVSGGTFIGSFTGQVTRTIFDYVLASQPNLCVQNGEILDERFDGHNALSDHALVQGTFCVGAGCSGCAGSSYTPETEAPETEAPETEAPETEAPETEAPETEAPETEAPETEAPAQEDTALTPVPENTPVPSMQPVRSNSCEDGMIPMSVAGARGIFCLDTKNVCAGSNAEGACPEKQEGLPSGSECVAVKGDVYGCKIIGKAPPTKECEAE